MKNLFQALGKSLDGIVAFCAKIFKWDSPQQISLNSMPANQPPDAMPGPQPSPIPKSIPVDPDSIVYAWDTPSHNYHNTRVLCDKAGFSVEEKNVLCACIYEESNFYNYLPDGNPVKHENLNGDGTIASTDWGICQINDYYNIGSGKPFSTVQYVLATPQSAVSFMIEAWLRNEQSLWDSYKLGEYKKWLTTDSPMWALAK